MLQKYYIIFTILLNYKKKVQNLTLYDIINKNYFILEEYICKFMEYQENIKVKEEFFIFFLRRADGRRRIADQRNRARGSAIPGHFRRPARVHCHLRLTGNRLPVIAVQRNAVDLDAGI